MPDPLAALAVVLATATPSPAPTAPRGLDPEDVSPGLAGFLATAAVVVACIVLIVNLVGRLRRIRYRAERDARAEAARAGGEAAELPPDESVIGTVTRVEDRPPRGRAKRPEHLE